MTIHVPPAASARLQVPLSDLGLAPENLRSHEPEDDDVPRLAETLRAAGLIYPLVVRKGRKGEQPFMVLDGRRRRFALLRLAAAGAIPADHPVECIVAGDRAAQAAAAILPNAEHAPVHLADVIVAIGKLRRVRLTTGAIAAALGYDETEVRRLDALAAVHPDVLAAFRQGRLSLRQVRLFARLKDKARQGEFARQALEGYFYEGGLQALVVRGRATTDDVRFALVPQEAYLAVGGRLREDLFGELPAEVLDPDRLDDLWRAAALRIGQRLAGEGLRVEVATGYGLAAPDGLEHMPFVRPGAVSAEQRAALDAAIGRMEAASEAAASADEPAAREDALGERLVAELALARLRAGAEVAAAVLTPDSRGVDVTFFRRPPAPDAPASAAAQDRQADGEDDREPWRADVVTPPVEVDVVGLNHAQHAARTAIATQGLAADLAARPEIALVALTAHLFRQASLNDPGGWEASALQVAVRTDRPEASAERPDAGVWARLAARREAFLATGTGRPIAFVAGLAPDERTALLADLVAVLLDLREARSDRIRPEARAEAAEIAALCGADLSRRWTPDAAFLRLHSRDQLLAFLKAMGATAPRKPLRKDELVRLVAEAADTRRWLPAALRWTPAAETEANPADDPGGEADVAQAA